MLSMMAAGQYVCRVWVFYNFFISFFAQTYIYTYKLVN